jgi:hypothetical protein
MAVKEIAVKKYVVKLTEAEREYLQSLISKGKSPAKRLLKARILLKADALEQGEGWSDGRIIEALDTNMSMVTRVRQQFVEEGLEKRASCRSAQWRQASRRGVLRSSSTFRFDRRTRTLRRSYT